MQKDENEDVDPWLLGWPPIDQQKIHCYRLAQW